MMTLRIEKMTVKSNLALFQRCVINCGQWLALITTSTTLGLSVVKYSNMKNSSARENTAIQSPFIQHGASIQRAVVLL